MDEYVTEFNWDDVDIEGNAMYCARERVVRCRDCLFAKDGGVRCGHFLDECGDGPALVYPDGFCAWGERRK